MSHYDVLGVAPGARPGEVRRAYVDLARVHHPDRHGGDTTQMQALNEAWSVLRDPDRRAAYDRTLVGARPQAEPATPTRVRTDEEELLVDLADDRSLGGRVVLPGWLSLVPPATFVTSVLLVVGGALFASVPMLSMGAAMFAVSCACFLAAPFVALLSSRRSTGRGGGAPPR